LAKIIRKYYPVTKERFYYLQKNLLNLEYKESAAVFYVLNRCSFSGVTLSGGMSPNHPRFNLKFIDKVSKYKLNNIEVNKSDFRQSIPKHKNDFLYCDPPYLIESNLYGQKGDLHKNFNHEDLYDLLDSHHGWILSYNDCLQIRKMYSKYKIVELDWKYGMGKNKNSNEIMVLNI